MSLFGPSKVTVGYWYNLAIDFGFGGPIDAFLEFRGGDYPAWQGNMTTPGTINIVAEDLWGGVDGEGGISGTLDLAFGSGDQAVNPNLVSTFGASPAYRGRSGAFFSGKYGAFSPYPKPAAFKFRAIHSGWPGEEWYPEKAEIVFEEGYYDIVKAVALTTNGGIPSVDGEDWGGAVDGRYPHNAVSAMSHGGYNVAFCPVPAGGAGFARWPINSIDDLSYSTGAAVSFEGGNHDMVWYPYDNSIICALGQAGVLVSRDLGATHEVESGPWINRLATNGYGLCGYSTTTARLWFKGFGGTWTERTLPFPLYYGVVVAALSSADYLIGGRGDSATGVKLFRTGGGIDYTEESLPDTVATGSVGFSSILIDEEIWLFGLEDGRVVCRDYPALPEVVETGLSGTIVSITKIRGLYIAATSSGVALSPDGSSWSVALANLNENISAILVADQTQANPSLSGMNPAHIIYKRMLLKGEPASGFNDASMRTAADVFFAERLGLCTSYDHTKESHEDFIQRICNVAGANFTRSRVDGLWYLDPLREVADKGSLPVLTDEDILEWGEEPSIIDDAVNQVTVKWFDPTEKEDRVTAPVQSLGAIQAAGAINAETYEYKEVPWEPLALRLAERDLRQKSTPLTRFPLKTGRRAYAWRKGQRIRLQCPRRGIADAVVMIGEIDVGTLRSGSIAMTVVQDVFSMPASSYIVSEPGVDTRPDLSAKPSPSQRMIEASYRDLAASETAANLAGMDPTQGLALFLAQRPSGSINYSLYTAISGEGFADQGAADWTPTAIAQDAVGAAPEPVEVTLLDGVDLSNVEVGTAVQWDSEVCRLDAIDLAAGTATLSRACADTVPAEHLAGSRLWFYAGTDWSGADGQLRVAGDAVVGKARTRTSAQALELSLAPAAAIVIEARANAPYPPAGVTVNDQWPPGTTSGALTVVWLHRDRLQQGSELVEWLAPSIGPEDGVTYTAELRGADESLLASYAGAAPTADLTPTIAVADTCTLEVSSWRDGVQCLQPVVASFYYSSQALIPLELESGDGTIADETNADFFME